MIPKDSLEGGEAQDPLYGWFSFVYLRVLGGQALFRLAPFPLRIVAATHMFVSLCERQMCGSKARQAPSRDFQVHNCGLEVARFHQSRPNPVVRPSRVGLKLNRLPQMIGRLAVFPLRRQRRSQRILRQVKVGIADTTGVSDAMTRSGLDCSRAAAITLLAIVILSLGSVPATAAAAQVDFADQRIRAKPVSASQTNSTPRTTCPTRH
jgi:hypothetical protein